MGNITVKVTRQHNKTRIDKKQKLCKTANPSPQILCQPVQPCRTPHTWLLLDGSTRATSCTNADKNLATAGHSKTSDDQNAFFDCNWERLETWWPLKMEPLRRPKGSTSPGTWSIRKHNKMRTEQVAVPKHGDTIPVLHKQIPPCDVSPDCWV